MTGHEPTPDQALPPGKKQWFGHPQGLTIISLTGMWEVFALFGTRTVLVYYLSKELLFSESAAVTIYSVSSAAAVVFSLVGAVVADRISGKRRAVVIGGLLFAVGQFALISPALLFPSLLLIAVGDGLMKPPLIAQIGLLYNLDDTRRDRAFTFFKVGCNCGTLVAPLVFGLVALKWGWSSAFLVGGVAVLLSVATYLLRGDSLPLDPVRKPTLKQGAVQKEALPASTWVTLSVAWLGAAFFWTAYNQLGGTVAFWADHNINRTLHLWAGTFVIPATWFQCVNPFLILAFAPIVTWIWRRHDTEVSAALYLRKMAVGTAYLAGSFAILAVADWTAKGAPHWLWLVVAIAPFSIGELYVDPVGQALFTRLAPKDLSSIFIAVWMLSIMTGYMASAWLAPAWERLSPAAYFSLVTVVTLIGLAVFALAGSLGPPKSKDPPPA